MFIKISALLFIVSLCSGESEHQTQTKHAISTQSFHRDDVPLSYKYTAIHTYERPKHVEQHQHHQQHQYQSSERPDYVQSSPQHSQLSDPTALYSKVALKNLQKYLYTHSQREAHPTLDHLKPVYQAKSSPNVQQIQHPQSSNIHYVPVQNYHHLQKVNHIQYYDTENSSATNNQPKDNFNHKINYLNQYLAANGNPKQTYASVPAYTKHQSSPVQQYNTQQYFGVPTANIYKEGSVKTVKEVADTYKRHPETTQKMVVNIGQSHGYKIVPNYDPNILNQNTFKDMFMSNSEAIPTRNQKILLLTIPNTKPFIHS